MKQLPYVSKSKSKNEIIDTNSFFRRYPSENEHMIEIDINSAKMQAKIERLVHTVVKKQRLGTTTSLDGKITGWDKIEFGCIDNIDIDNEQHISNEYLVDNQLKIELKKLLNIDDDDDENNCGDMKIKRIISYDFHCDGNNYRYLLFWLHNTTLNQLQFLVCSFSDWFDNKFDADDESDYDDSDEDEDEDDEDDYDEDEDDL